VNRNRRVPQTKRQPVKPVKAQRTAAPTMVRVNGFDFGAEPVLEIASDSTVSLRTSRTPGRTKIKFAAAAASPDDTFEVMKRIAYRA